MPCLKLIQWISNDLVPLFQGSTSALGTTNDKPTNHIIFAKVLIHDSDFQLDVLQASNGIQLGQVKEQCLVEDWILCVFLGVSLGLGNELVLVPQGQFHIGISFANEPGFDQVPGLFDFHDQLFGSGLVAQSKQKVSLGFLRDTNAIGDDFIKCDSEITYFVHSRRFVLFGFAILLLVSLNNWWHLVISWSNYWFGGGNNARFR